MQLVAHTNHGLLHPEAEGESCPTSTAGGSFRCSPMGRICPSYESHARSPWAGARTILWTSRRRRQCMRRYPLRSDRIPHDCFGLHAPGEEIKNQRYPNPPAADTGLAEADVRIHGDPPEQFFTRHEPRAFPRRPRTFRIGLLHGHSSLNGIPRAGPCVYPVPAPAGTSCRVHRTRVIPLHSLGQNLSIVRHSQEYMTPQLPVCVPKGTIPLRHCRDSGRRTKRLCVQLNILGI